MKVYILSFDVGKNELMCGHYGGVIFGSTVIACSKAPIVGNFVRIVNGMNFDGFDQFALCEVAVMGSDSFGKCLVQQL